MAQVALITDFTRGADVRAFAGLGVAGPMAAAVFVAGMAALDADDRLIYDQATGWLWYDADGSGAGVAAALVDLGAGTALALSDLVIV